MKALITESPGKTTVADVENLPVRDTYIKIKVHSVALNPTDWKHVHYICQGGEIMGCDIAGTVEDVGSQVQSEVKKGDRIAGVVNGGNIDSPRDGGYAEYAQIKDGLFTHLPTSWSWAEGATLGVGITTVGQGLYQSLKLPLPTHPAPNPFPVLIYGGSTATGTLAIQLARMSGLQVITTASPQHFGLLKELGATLCYDYNQKNVGHEIRRETGDNLLYAFDCITNEQSMEICAEALASGGTGKKELRYSALMLPDGFPRNDCNARRTMAYTAIGERTTKRGTVFEASKEDWEFGVMFWKLCEKLIADGKLKPHPVEERSGGIHGIQSGLDDMKEGKVRGKKLVYAL